MRIIDYWPNPEDDPTPHRAWVNDVFDAAANFSTGGAYVNSLDDEGADRVRAAYGSATFARLARVKRRWDPENLFRLNQNIPPENAPT